MYETKTFSIPTLNGISEETITEHLGLYAGYVKHVNKITTELQSVTDAYARAEMQRRLGFEFGGMKNHEYYFSQFEGGTQSLPDGTLKTMIETQWGSYEAWENSFKELAATRGVGWAMLYIDRANNVLVQSWIDEQHLGQLADVDVVLALDMWEHSYMRDLPASRKKEYIEAFFSNLNWQVVSNRI